MKNNIPIPLCIDLDGTLLNSDLLWESIFTQVKRQPLTTFYWPRWLMAGKANFKAQLAKLADLDIETLPYNQDFLAFLQKQKTMNRPLILVTATHRLLAEKIATHLGLFDRVLATDNDNNLSGENKARLLVELYGERGFDYAGNSNVDLAVWKHARHAIIVNASDKITNQVSIVTEIEQRFETKTQHLKQWIKAARLHQWLKNTLIFIPLIAAHAWNSPEKITLCLLAFLSFGLCASSVYLLNDLLDISADRRHPRKCRRPFAAGALPIWQAAFLIPILLLLSFFLSLFINPLGFSICLIIYYILTLAYSFHFKRILMLDAIILAGLYTLRIVTGAIASSVILSFWLLAFSMFIFLSLALVKRYAELKTLLDAGKLTTEGRDYHVDDLSILQNLGSSAGYLAVLVLALYINSPDVQRMYDQPLLIGLLCPLLLYWISRVWLLAHRGNMPDDPVVFALTDKTSQGLAIASAIIIWGAL